MFVMFLLIYFVPCVTNDRHDGLLAEGLQGSAVAEEVGLVIGISFGGKKSTQAWPYTDYRCITISEKRAETVIILRSTSKPNPPVSSSQKIRVLVVGARLLF